MLAVGQAAAVSCQWVECLLLGIEAQWARWVVVPWCCVATRSGATRCGWRHPQLGFDMLARRRINQLSYEVG